MHNILVCHTGGWIGDMVLLTPTLRALKQAYPDSRLSLLLRPIVADLMASNPYVDTCIIDSKKEGHLRSTLKLIYQIKKSVFDIAVVLHPTSIRNALIPYLARIPIRIGSNFKGRGVFLTSSCQHKINLHEVERYLTVVKLLTLDQSSYSSTSETTNNPIQTNLEYWHSKTDTQTITNLLQLEGVSSSDRLIGINLGTTWNTKRWNNEAFDEVINFLTTTAPDIKIALTGSYTEQPILRQLKFSQTTIDLVGKIDILQLGALLERCELYLTCDSGPMHIAAAVGTPTIALFGPTDPVRHKPYGLEHSIIEKPVSCRPCYKTYCKRIDTPKLCMEEIRSTEVCTTITQKLKIENSI